MSHSQVSNVERAYGSASLDFWLRHEWLDGMLTKRLGVLINNYPIMSAISDSMLLFAFMMAQTAVIYLCTIIETIGSDHQYQPAIMEYQKRAAQAAQEIARLAKAHEHIGYFKVSTLSPFRDKASVAPPETNDTSLLQSHIFLPLTVFYGASRLMDRSRSSEMAAAGFPQLDTDNRHGQGGDLQSCMDSLRKLQSFNNLAREHLHVLEAQEFRADYI